MLTGREELLRFPVEVPRIVEIGGGEFVTRREVLGHLDEMRAAAAHPATILFSMSHGLGAPRPGWASPEDQRALQGAMQIHGRDARITAADIESWGAFLPGGAWLFFACFSAGTPGESAYLTWLTQLHQVGLCSDPRRDVLGSLPEDGRGFAAALPQAALAHEKGPLGVIGHVDLAWCWSFLDGSAHGNLNAAERRPDRFRRVLQSLAQGHRFGVGIGDVGGAFSAATHRLATMYEHRERSGGGGESESDKAERADLWMRRQDLGAYVLLGDPAARLPLARVQRSRGGLIGAADPPLDEMEKAVLSVLRAEQQPRVIASRHGVSVADLARWKDTYRGGGRAALAALIAPARRRS